MNSGYDASHVTHRRGIVSNADADDELGARSISYPPPLSSDDLLSFPSSKNLLFEILIPQ